MNISQVLSDVGLSGCEWKSSEEDGFTTHTVFVPRNMMAEREYDDADSGW